MEKLIIIGAGGYAKSVLDSVDQYNYIMTGFIDEFSKEKEHLGYPILADSFDSFENKNKYVYFIAVGNNENRKKWYDRLVAQHCRLINVIDKSAIISPRATVGNGNFIGKMTIVNGYAEVGNNCIVNTKALMEHGTKIGDHVNLSTMSVINGDVQVGDGCFIGSNATVIGQLSIGEWSTVGAGSVVIRPIESHVTVAGSPARLIRRGAEVG